MLITRRPESSHWYHRDGRAFYVTRNAAASEREGVEVMRPVTIRDAVKAGAYRSVTNVLSVLAKEGLVKWRIEQAILSALTLPRLPHETEHEFAERVIEDAEQQSKKAAEAGTRIHEICGIWTMKQTPPPPAIAHIIAPFQDWWTANVAHPIANEIVGLCHAHHFAGTLDMPAMMLDGSIAIIDLKTQEVKMDDKGRPKPGFYDEHALQLAAYSRCMFASGAYVPPFPWRLITLVLDRTRPGIYPKEWTDPAHPLESSEDYFQAFLSAAQLWSYLKGCTPGKDATLKK